MRLFYEYTHMGGGTGRKCGGKECYPKRKQAMTAKNIRRAETSDAPDIFVYKCQCGW